MLGYQCLHVESCDEDVNGTWTEAKQRMNFGSNDTFPVHLFSRLSRPNHH